MNFNPDTGKEAHEVIIILKLKTHSQFVFNNNPVDKTSAQKPLQMFLDFKLNLQGHFENEAKLFPSH